MTEAELDTLAYELDVRQQHEATHGEAEMCGSDCIALGLAEFDDPMPCPACHCPDHDPGSCPNCPRCELHVDEALIWVARVSREDYDEFVEAIEAEVLRKAWAAVRERQMADLSDETRTVVADMWVRLDDIRDILAASDRLEEVMG